jgi:type IV pilus assembly protein PilQ
MKYQNKQMGLRMWQGILFSLVMLLGSAAHAQTAIESVTGSVQGGVEVVRIDLSQALTAVPTGFAIQSPARRWRSIKAI